MPNLYSLAPYAFFIPQHEITLYEMKIIASVRHKKRSIEDNYLIRFHYQRADIDN